MKYWEKLGLTKTVYSLIYPETRKVLSNLWKSNPLHLYENAYLGAQDPFDKKFFKAWIKWVKPVVKLGSFTYQYPTAGSTEGIRESLAQYANTCYLKHLTPVIHVFHGEYEGYEAQANSYGIKVIKHDRNDWKKIKPLEHHQFYLSQPSAIDGNLWNDFESFINYLQSSTPQTKVNVDLCYVGAVAKKYYIDLTSPNINKIFFSLSKLFGVYYHRIGGTLSKEAMPGLYGNMWFKNMFSLKLGIELMKKFKVNSLPKKYKKLQKKECQKLTKKTSLDWLPSDAVMLTYCLNFPKNKTCNLLKRGNKTSNLRACLTPLLDKELK